MNVATEMPTRNCTARDPGLPVAVPDGRNVALAASVAQEILDRPLFPSRVPDLERERAGILLSVLTYCYARGCLRSEEVQLEAGENPSVRWLGAETEITAGEIQSFRRRHFSLVASCLAEFVLRSAVLHPGEAFATEANRLRRAVAEKQAQERLAFVVLNDPAVA
jgi:hypothetical protein